MSFYETNFELLTLLWLKKFGDTTRENREIQDNNIRVFDNC